MNKNDAIRKKAPAEKIIPPRWYRNEVFEYEKCLKTKGKVVAYFKLECGRYGMATRGGGAKREMVKFLKVYENGMCVVVDTTMWKISVVQSLGTPFKLKPARKPEFDKALKAILKAL